MSSSSTEEGGVAAPRPDESVERLLSSDIVQVDDIDVSTYIEGVSFLGDEEDDDDYVVDETLECAASTVGGDSVFEATLSADEAARSRGDKGPAAAAVVDVVDKIVASIGATNEEADAESNGDEFHLRNDEDDDQDDDDDDDEVSSIFNVSHEIVIGEGENEMGHPEGIGGDGNECGTDARCAQDGRSAASSEAYLAAQGESAADDAVVEDSSDHSTIHDDDDVDPAHAAVPDSSPSRQTGDPPSSLSPSRRNFSLVHEDDNALHQFPTQSSEAEEPSAAASSALDATAIFPHPHGVQHRPSEADENTPPNAWGLTEALSRWQHEQKQEQPQLLTHSLDTDEANVGGGDDVFDENEVGPLSHHEVDDDDDEKENENGENRNLSPTSSCRGDGRGPSNHSNALQGKRT